MESTVQLVLGVVLVAAGAVLLLFFRDAEFLWFRGQPLGIVLAIVGAVDLAELGRKRSS